MTSWSTWLTVVAGAYGAGILTVEWVVDMTSRDVAQLTLQGVLYRDASPALRAFIPLCILSIFVGSVVELMRHRNAAASLALFSFAGVTGWFLSVAGGLTGNPSLEDILKAHPAVDDPAFVRISQQLPMVNAAIMLVCVMVVALTMSNASQLHGQADDKKTQ